MLENHDGKAFRFQPKAEYWGGQWNGDSGVASEYRVWKAWARNYLMSAGQLKPEEKET